MRKSTGKNISFNVLLKNKTKKNKVLAKQEPAFPQVMTFS